jgi:uncharacterized protein DUF4333
LTRALVIACSLAAAAAVAGCGTKTLDVPAAEREIAKRLTSEEGRKFTVRCPEEVEIKRGDTFQCRATADGQDPANVRVTQLDDKGRVRWVVTRR